MTIITIPNILTKNLSPEEEKALSDFIKLFEETSREDVIKLVEERFEARLTERISELKGEMVEKMAEMKSELRSDMADMKSELRGEMADMKSELRSDMADMKVTMIKWFVGAAVSQVALILAVLAIFFR